MREKISTTAKAWHSLEITEAIRELDSNPRGLSSEEAQRRLAQFGPNELAEEKKISPWMLLLEQFKSFLIIILLIATIVSAALAVRGEGDIWDPILIAVVVLFAAILGFVQEYRSERAMEALKQMTALTAAVIRDGEEKEVPARELVPGDIVLLRTGDRAPADARLMEAINLRTDEAALTGESTPVDKATVALPGDVPVGDRRNMVHMGTTAVYGRGKAIITGTGMVTEFGKIAGVLQEVKAPPTPLQVSLDKVGKILGIACLVICAIVAVVGIMVEMFDRIIDAFIWGVSLAVAAVPEALPAVVTISLALGVQRMAKRHALMRRLPAVETLGCATFICSDKTGTLTQDEMTVRKLYVNDKIIDVTGVGYEPKGEFYLDGIVFDPQHDSHLQTLLQAAALCNDSYLVNINGVWQLKGDPTEGALVVVAAKAGIEPEGLLTQSPRVGEVPFSSERKKMTTVHDTPRGKIAYSKGAPEVILSSCDRLYTDGQEKELTEQDKLQILEINKQMAGQALRVLGMAYKQVGQAESTEEAEKGMVFVGLAGMIDPPREEVKGAVQVCNQAKIESVMITGDHKLTAMAIAKELGLLDEEGMAVSGSELDEISDEELDKMVERIKVYARVSPAHKMRVVEALQKKGHVVAMTGDGVNDAPALKKADIGVAMGITGTDVSKEAAAMVLADDNFASIVAAIEEGRGIFANIKKFLMYLLSCNVGEVLLMLIAFVVTTTVIEEHVLPLVALQLLWVNLVTDGLPALALAVDPAEPDIMRQSPRKRKESVFSRSLITFIGGAGLWTMAATLGVFLWALLSDKDHVEAQCLCFATLIMLELFNCFNCRSERYSIFKVSPFANKWLLAAVASSLALSLMVIYVPFFQGPFNTYSLSLIDWGVVVLAGFSIVIVVEIGKFAASRRRQEELVVG